MDIGEAVGLDVHVEKDEYCEGVKYKEQGWQSTIIKHGDNTTCDAAVLYRSMAQKAPHTYPGFVGLPGALIKKAGRSAWKKSDCSSTSYPFQAHHLIPKNHLPKQGICAFLATGYSGQKDFTLAEATFYSTDHANNGYCMPYASALTEWQGAGDAKKTSLANWLMSLATRQLHQGAHSDEEFTPDPPVPHEDLGFHGKVTKGRGYLPTVDQLLDCVQKGASMHAAGCDTCNEGEDGILPLPATVRHVDQVSGILKMLIDANWIFVSKRASKWGTLKKFESPDWMKK